MIILIAKHDLVDYGLLTDDILFFLFFDHNNVLLLLCIFLNKRSFNLQVDFRLAFLLFTVAKLLFDLACVKSNSHCFFIKDPRSLVTLDELGEPSCAFLVCIDLDERLLLVNVAVNNDFLPRFCLDCDIL